MIARLIFLDLKLDAVAFHIQVRNVILQLF